MLLGEHDDDDKIDAGLDMLACSLSPSCVACARLLRLVWSPTCFVPFSFH